MRIQLLSVIAAFALCGCTQSPTASTDAQSGHGPAPVQQPAAQTVPDALKSDAYYYYGLSSDKPMKVKLTATGRAPMSGTETVHFKSVEKGNAIFEIERTGDIQEQLGSDTVSLEPSGVYTIKSTRITTANLHNIELPAKLTPGTTWTNTGKFDSDAGSMQQDATFKVIGPDKVTTEAGTEDAILVVATGQMTLSGRKLGMNARMWYVKDKGMVKSVSKLTDLAHPKEKPNEITIQETK